MNGITVERMKTCRGRAWRKSRKVRIPEVKSAITYALALHELGHVIGRQSGRRLDQDVQAWEWARRAALEWRKPMKRYAAKCIASYLKWCQRRRRGRTRHGEWRSGRDARKWLGRAKRSSLSSARDRSACSSAAPCSATWIYGTGR